MSEVIIKTENLTKDYGQGRGIFDINLEIEKGQVYGFVGTNGSGKTTTIRNMMGFIKPDKGHSTVNGLDSWTQAAEIMRNVSYVPGEIAFPSLSTGTEFLKCQADYLGVKDFTYMNHLIEVLQLDPTANLKRMSKGMKQKTALVAALMGEKDILVLDEPTTGLDPLMRESFLDLIREEKDKGHTIFMSSHIFEEIEDVCDKVAMIKDGHIIGITSLYDLRHPVVKKFVIHFSKANELKEFHETTNFNSVINNDCECEVNIKKEQMNVLFSCLKNYDVLTLQEQHLSLEKEFMKAYKGEQQNG